MENLRDDIVLIIKNICHSVVIGADDDNRPLVEIGVDSLDFSSILLEIEEKYGIRIPDEDINKLETVKKISTYVASKK